MKAKEYRESGFSRIELLVVISMLAILGITLIPAIAANGRDSVSIKCLNNLKQIGRALFQYADDHEGLIPRGETNDVESPVWFEILSPYLSDVEGALGEDVTTGPVFKCPNYADKKQAITYANNAWGFTDPNDNTGRQLQGLSALSEVTNPSDTAYAVDYEDDDRNGLKESQIEYTALGQATGTYFDIYAPEHLPYISARGGLKRQSPLTIRRVALKRHALGSNFLYLDGHAGYLAALDVDAYLWRTQKE